MSTSSLVDASQSGAGPSKGPAKVPYDIYTAKELPGTLVPDPEARLDIKFGFWNGMMQLGSRKLRPILVEQRPKILNTWEEAVKQVTLRKKELDDIYNSLDDWVGMDPKLKRQVYKAYKSEAVAFRKAIDLDIKDDVIAKTVEIPENYISVFTSMVYDMKLDSGYDTTNPT